MSQHVRILADAGLVKTGDGRQRPCPAPELTSRFMSQAFGGNIEPFAVPEYLVADAR